MKSAVPNQALPPSKLIAVDLFAGCGGLSLGFQNAGISVRWANEIDSAAATTYRANFPATYVVEQDVRILVTRLLDRERGLPSRGEVDILAGGPPCQGFSDFNRFRSPDDPRNSLMSVYLQAVDLLSPNYVLIEN